MYAREEMKRVALVLGAGGTVGSAFHAGVLAALAESGWDGREAELIVGTSAGSSTGALLRAGLAPRDLLARATGEALSPEGQAIVGRFGGPPPPPPRWRAGGSPWDPARWRQGRSGDARGGGFLAGLVRGGTSMEPLIQMFDPVFPNWPERPLWICSVRVSDAARVVFGKRGAESASVARAVAASCAIPGIYSPVQIGEQRYVDGGVHSLTNLDVLAASRPELVVVSAPWSAGEELRVGFDVPLRQLFRAQLVLEISRLKRSLRVLAIEPTAAEQREMGLDALDPDKRPPVARAAYEGTARRLRDGDLRPLRELLERGA